MLAPSALRALLLLFVSGSVIACGGGNAASRLAKGPEYDPRGQTKCSVEKSQAKPLIVEWPSADRGELETQARRGLVVVRYSGCEMTVLDGCTTPVKYGYAPIIRKKDRVTMRDADDLYANVPIGAARLEAQLEKSGELDVDMTLVGRWESERRDIRASELHGQCNGATHVVAALTVGSFTFTAGAAATVGGGATVLGAGAGGKSSSRRDELAADGDVSACEKATSADRAPPEGCGALIRIEVVALAEGERTSSGAAVSPSPSKPSQQAACARGDAAACTSQCDGEDWASCANLGTMYRSGQGVSKDEYGAASLFQRACDGGVEMACGALGDMYEAGSADPRGVQRDFAKALPLYEKACARGDGLGCVRLGVWYEVGLGGLTIDRNKSFALFQKSCERGSLQGCGALGHAYDKGVGVTPDRAAAIRFFRQGCQGGSGNAPSCGALRALGESP
jgi:uncharacterized protein